MPAPQAILDLVARFRDNAASYLAGAYNEAQLRQEFVNPLFKQLGWDMDNEQGYAESYKDVIHPNGFLLSDIVQGWQSSTRNPTGDLMICSIRPEQSYSIVSTFRQNPKSKIESSIFTIQW